MSTPTPEHRARTTAAPTPRDGERAADYSQLADKCYAVICNSEAHLYPAENMRLADFLETTVAQRIAEAVGPLERDIGFLKGDLSEAESDRDSLAALVVQLKEPLQDIRTALDNGDAETAWHVMDRQGDKALGLVPADLADSVCVKRSEWEALNESFRIASMNHKGTLGDLLREAKEGGDARVRNAALEADNRALREALANLVDACDGNYAELVAECKTALAPKEGL